MGRPKQPNRLIVTSKQLDYLARCCTDPEMRMVWTDESGQARINVRVDVLRELIAMARFGKGLATLNAKSPEEKSAAGRRAARARWAPHWARKHPEDAPGSAERDARAKPIAGGLG